MLKNVESILRNSVYPQGFQLFNIMQEVENVEKNFSFALAKI